MPLKDRKALPNVLPKRELDGAARQVCGFDFNEIVLSGPLDGQVHEYTCPGCGQTGTYKAPLLAQ